MGEVLLVHIEIEKGHIKGITTIQLDLGNSDHHSVVFVEKEDTLTTSVQEILYVSTVRGQNYFVRRREDRQERLFHNIITEQSQQNQILIQSLQRCFPLNQDNRGIQWTHHYQQLHPSQAQQTNHQLLPDNRYITR